MAIFVIVIVAAANTSVDIVSCGSGGSSNGGG